MKFASQEGLVPGDQFADKLTYLEEAGYDGIELDGVKAKTQKAAIKRAFQKSSIKPACICGGYSFDLLSPEKTARDKTVEQLKELLAISGELEAQGVILVPIFGPAQLPDLSPWKDARELEEKLLIEQLVTLTEYAKKQGTEIILEPLNRYETHFLNRLQQAEAICNQINSPGLSILADLFHMNIEETNMTDSIDKYNQSLGYVHLADSNRLLPGKGHTDFQSIFTKLKEIKYDGWMSLECGVPDNNSTALRTSLEFMKEQM
ncbi:sugar phosphate isomerase/epimerase family protein [Gracilibacillus sp. YIM 98692]|uniref:sugar phosphate isomerase/epimerase family protein n=1 Tax=Gracilibacillus sp. YIM 98692 TaxID=2663532 RepID=UPI0013D5EAB4|nr:sugar phosphate isomerase/epimerase family protein [Gracilibacillus sp. YIM 98692]